MVTRRKKWGMDDEIDFIQHLGDSGNKRINTEKKKELLQNYLKTLRNRVWDTEIDTDRLEKLIQDELAKLKGGN